MPVCLYLINVNGLVDPVQNCRGNREGCSEFKKVSQSFHFCKIKKIHEKLSFNPLILFLLLKKIVEREKDRTTIKN